MGQRNGPGLASTSGVLRVLDPIAEAQLTHARELLATLRDTLVQFSASADDQAALAASMRQLDDLFLLVIVGEFNVGKSALINALLGQPLLQEGVTPTTAQIQILKYGDSITRRNGARRAAARPSHRRHARDERDRPRTRAADHRIRPTVGPRGIHDLGRPSVHRNGASLPHNHS